MTVGSEFNGLVEYHWLSSLTAVFGSNSTTDLVLPEDDDSDLIKPVSCGFTGFKSAAEEALPQTQTVLDPFHVVRWASNMLDECRRRVQHDILGRRGRKNDLLYKSRPTTLTRISYLSNANKKQLVQLFADERHLELDCT